MPLLTAEEIARKLHLLSALLSQLPASALTLRIREPREDRGRILWTEVVAQYNTAWLVEAVAQRLEVEGEDWSGFDADEPVRIRGKVDIDYDKEVDLGDFL